MAPIRVAGIGGKWAGTPDIASALARVNDGAAIIAITHTPDIFPSIPARVALTSQDTRTMARFYRR